LRLILLGVAVRQLRIRRSHNINMSREVRPYICRRLRQVRWKEWKTTGAKRHNLRIRGISESSARKWGGSSKGYWRVAGSKILQVSLPNSYWDRLGLKTLSQTLAASQSDGLTNRRMRAPHVRWCGRGRGDPRPLPDLRRLHRHESGSYQPG
jgi:hypothetical protein